MTAKDGSAPGGPGAMPRWTSSAKAAVGTAMSARSMVWFTIAKGIVDEVFYPRVDQANVRNMGMIVTADPEFYADEPCDTETAVEILAPGAPGYRVTNNCTRGRFRISKTIVTDSERDVLLQQTEFVPLLGALSDYRLYVVLAPHIANQGGGNDAWIGEYKGTPMLFAQRDGFTLALSCTTNPAAMSCGFVGVNDGRTQLARDGRLTECYTSANDGNIALTAEIDLARCDGRFILALAFGRTPDEAGHAARAALLLDFDATCRRFVSGWSRFHSRSRALAAESASDEYRLSLSVLQAHEDKVRRGAFIASLSIPWGNDRGDHDLGGYHVVWPRDLVEIAGALLAAGHTETAQHALHYLMTTQAADGRWPQNMWLDGRPYWSGNQLDETAFPILLADHLRRNRALAHLNPWPMVRRAAAYLVRNGPVTPEDRWEEDGGYATFTLAVEIAALLAAADFADRHHDATAARYLRETADIWHASLDRWTYVTGTPLARRVGVSGYYVRIAPPDKRDGGRRIPVANRPVEEDGADARVDYSAMVSPDALALVRFGIRAADDERMLNTIRVVDALLCADTPTGPIWHRYNGDGYGEHADGTPFDGTGIGRGWPLLAGERAHYELAAGRFDRAAYLLDVMQRQTGIGGLLPEQVWDSADIPDRGLFLGRPSSSAMPLAWAHAELVKLVRSLHDRQVFDAPPQTIKRYVRSDRPCRTMIWRFNNKLRSLPAGHVLRIEAQAAMTVHWTADDWRTTHDVDGADGTLGMWFADLPTDSLAEGSTVRFTFHWAESDRWEGEDFAVAVD